MQGSKRLGLGLTRGLMWPWNQPQTQPEDPEALEYWESLLDDNSPLTRFLCNSIYDFLRNCRCGGPPLLPTPPGNAKSYVSPEMFRWLETWFMVPNPSSKDKDFEYLDTHTGDLLLFAFYITHDFAVEEKTRPGCPENKMPYITRDTLFLWIKMQISYDPSRVHYKINQLLCEEEILLLDPRTDEPWKYKIPRSLFPPEADPKVKNEVVPNAQKVWDILREEILEKRREEALANGKLRDNILRDVTNCLQELTAPGEPTQKEWMKMQSQQDPQMQMMNQAATNSINMSNMTTNNIQQMSLARNGENIAAWGALHYRQNLRHMGAGQF